MPTYSRAERLAAIQKAGFADPLKALAVSLAEFGENRDVNTQGQSDYIAGGQREESYGPWQINLPAHPNVTRSCALDLECSTEYAARLSKGGTDFGPWSAFTNGSYSRFMAEIKGSLGNVAASPGPSPSPTGSPAPAPSTDCRTLNSIDIARAALLNWQGNTPTQIAEALGVDLACLKLRLGQAIDQTTAIPGVHNADELGTNIATSGAAKAIGDTTGAAKSTSELIAKVTAPDNLWRAGFVILGAALIFFGARLYLRSDEPAKTEAAT